MPWKLIPELCHMASGTITDVSDYGNMFGGVMYGGTGTGAFIVDVYTRDSEADNWEHIYGSHSAYSGMTALGQFPCKKYIKIDHSGTNIAAHSYMWIA